jgi:hypothetical protein
LKLSVPGSWKLSLNELPTEEWIAVSARSAAIQAANVRRRWV